MKALLIALSFLACPHGIAEVIGSPCPPGENSSAPLDSSLRNLANAIGRNGCSDVPEVQKAFKRIAELSDQPDVYQLQDPDFNLLAAIYEKYGSVMISCKNWFENRTKYKETFSKYPELSTCVCPARISAEVAHAICQKSKQPIYLSNDEYNGIGFYQISWFSIINNKLRSRDPKEICEVFPVITSIESALRKFPRYQGLIYRGADLPPEVLQMHQKGSVVQYDAFTSTSKDNQIAAKFSSYGKGWLFTIKPKASCYDITSLNPSEREVLCSPGTRFRVDARDDNSRTIEMTEVE